MADDYLKILAVLAQYLCSARRYIIMAGSMETVTADLILLIILLGQTVHICLSGHGLMECGIEYCCLGHTRHILCACTDADQVSGIVERCQAA